MVYAACNYGSTALVTRQGALLMFGKDTHHCDANGVVQGLKREKVVKVRFSQDFLAKNVHYLPIQHQFYKFLCDLPYSNDKNWKYF